MTIFALFRQLWWKFDTVQEIVGYRIGETSVKFCCEHRAEYDRYWKLRTLSVKTNNRKSITLWITWSKERKNNEVLLIEVVLRFLQTAKAVESSMICLTFISPTHFSNILHSRPKSQSELHGASKSSNIHADHPTCRILPLLLFLKISQHSLDEVGS